MRRNIRRRERRRGAAEASAAEFGAERGGSVRADSRRRASGCKEPGRRRGGVYSYATPAAPRAGSGRIKAGKHLRKCRGFSSCSGKVGPYASEILDQCFHDCCGSVRDGAFGSRAAAGFFRATDGRSCGGCRKEGARKEEGRAEA